MKKLFIVIAFTLCLCSCQKQTKLDNLQIGMPLTEVQALTSLEKIAANKDNTVYRCMVDGGANSMLKYRSVWAGSEPYLLVFDKNSTLVEIRFDNSESTRRMIRQVK